MARELIALKGATSMYDPVLRGVVEQAKIVLLRTNPMLSKELTEVTNKLHAEYAAKLQELRDISARVYAARFSEQELKDALTFYKTPLGKKLIQQEPQILDQSMKEVQSWGDKLSRGGHRQDARRNEEEGTRSLIDRDRSSVVSNQKKVSVSDCRSYCLLITDY